MAASRDGLLTWRAMYRRLLLAVLAALVVCAGLLAGCTPPRPERVAPAPPADGAQVATPPATPVAPVAVAIETASGVIELELYPDKAPRTVENFVKLVRASYYDGVLIHRVEPGFVVQAGDPQTVGLSAKELRGILARQKSQTPRSTDPPIGAGGPGWTIPLEISDLRHERGVIAMARSADPDSAGSQFYITLGEAPHLDGGYAVFGKVTAGMDVVDKLAVGDEILKVRITGE
jgi:cyclophilin family peptidyl-prolyl cis-trans isomerase